LLAQPTVIISRSPGQSKGLGRMAETLPRLLRMPKLRA
jgi:hypothetical protein